MTTVKEARTTLAATASRLATPERLLWMWRIEGHEIQHVKVLNSTRTDVKCVNSLTGITNIVVGDTISNAIPTLKTKDSMDNAGHASLRNDISGIPLVIEDALGNFLSEDLWSTTFQPDTSLNGWMTRLVGELVKNWLSSADFRNVLRAMIGEVFKFETCMPNSFKVVIDTQQFIGPVTQLIKTRIDKSVKMKYKPKDLWPQYLETANGIRPLPSPSGKCPKMNTSHDVERRTWSVYTPYQSEATRTLAIKASVAVAELKGENGSKS